jgi:uncharacterized membrane protein required for colicin V production
MTLNIIIDLILCAIIVLGAIIGVVRGFIRITAKPVKFIAAIVIAFSLCNPVAEKVVSPVIESSVTNYISDFLHEKCDEITPENAEEQLPTILKVAASIFDIDISETLEEGVNNVVETIVSTLAAPVVNIISVGIAFVGLYILSKIALSLLIFLIDLIFKNGVFGKLNKLLGFLFSTIIAIAAAWALAVLIAFVFNLPAFASNPQIQAFEGGFFYKFFNTYNPVELLLSF